MPDLGKIAKRYALQNAVHHSGEARAESVLGKLLAAEPELRKNVEEARTAVFEAVDSVNAMRPEGQKKLLEKLEEPLVPEKKEEKHALGSLPEAKHGKVVLRFAPNPDGALHLGNARPALLCDEYAKRYRGTLILRFDDTDPKVKVPEKKFYTWIRRDMKWLGIDVHKAITASGRLKIYGKYAGILLEKGGAYICTCSPEKWKATRNKGNECPCRSLSAEKNLERWNEMKKGRYKEGVAVLRIKTSMKHDNPAIRDWPAYRIVDKPQHPLVRAKLWPLFNFASAIDDHLLGITHIIRGQEHATNETKQRYLYRALGWEYPHVKVLGRLSISAGKAGGTMVMSKSVIRSGIEKGIFTGWDDPNVATLMALRRRGFQPETLRRIIVSLGASPSGATIALENLAGYNRRIVDSSAKRFFIVINPVKILLDRLPAKPANLRLHPEADMGFRIIKSSKSILVERDDLDRFAGKEVRLMGLCNVILGRKSRVTGMANKDIQKIHWLPASGNIRAAAITPEGALHGIAESSMIKCAAKGDVVQFERFGFCRIENISKTGVKAVFAHK